MAEIKKIYSSQADLNEINQILEKDGCIVIQDALDKQHLSQLQADIEAEFAEIPMCQGNFFGYKTKRMSSVLLKSAVSRTVALNPIVKSVMDEFLLQSCRQYQLNLTQAIQIHSDEPAQIMHTDDLMFPFELPVNGQQKMINCMWAVDDFTKENGATNLVPGSHKWPRERQAEPEEIAIGEMPAGSVLIYFGSLLHCGGGNITHKPRTGIVMSYCLGWLRQAENHYLALPVDVVKTFPRELQELIGYFVHEPNLGAVEGRHPIELLQGQGVLSRKFEEFIPHEVQGVIQEHRLKSLALIESDKAA